MSLGAFQGTLGTTKRAMTARGDFRAVVTLNGRRDARPYKEPIALVVAGFQPAIPASKNSMSSEVDEGLGQSMTSSMVTTSTKPLQP